MIPALLDRILELAFDPRVASFFGVCLGLYILWDVSRICLRLLWAFWRGRRKKAMGRGRFQTAPYYILNEVFGVILGVVA